MIPPPLQFTEADTVLAADHWGANCGPGALAAITNHSLEDVHPHIPLFDQRRYTNPSMMLEALRSLNANWKLRPDQDWPDFGLVRIQWEGPWTADSVPIRARYRYTHWIGACAHIRTNIGIFDINCIHVGGWVSLSDWSTTIVPWLVTHKGFNGKWHITHSIEVQTKEPL